MADPDPDKLFHSRQVGFGMSDPDPGKLFHSRQVGFGMPDPDPGKLFQSRQVYVLEWLIRIRTNYSIPDK